MKKIVIGIIIVICILLVCFLTLKNGISFNSRKYDNVTKTYKIEGFKLIKTYTINDGETKYICNGIDMASHEDMDGNKIDTYSGYSKDTTLEEATKLCNRDYPLIFDDDNNKIEYCPRVTNYTYDHEDEYAYYFIDGGNYCFTGCEIVNEN